MLETTNVGERIYPKVFSEAYRDHRNRYFWALDYIHENDRILDMACGVGYGSYFLAENSPCLSVTGVEISENALQWAKHYFSSEKVQYKQIDLSGNYPEVFLPETFDMITCFETIEHLEDDLGFLRKLYKILKDNGTLLISSPCEEVIPYQNNPFFEGGKNPYHFRHYRYDQFVSIITNAGFFVSEEYTQYEDIIKGRGLAVNILVCKKGFVEKRPLTELDQIIELCNALKFNSNFDLKLPDYNYLDKKFKLLVENYTLLEKASELIYINEFELARNTLQKVDHKLIPEKFFLEGLTYIGDKNYIEAFSCFSNVLIHSDQMDPLFSNLAKDHLKDLLEYFY